MERYSSRQKLLLAALFAAYTAAYISRANLAPALSAIQADFALTAAQAGLLPTLFSIPYALGQIVIGTLADRFPPRLFIGLGLLLSAAANVLFSFATAYPVLVALWCLNGCFQSMIWTPIVRIMAVEYQDSVRPRAMFTMSLTMIAGFLIAWALSGWLTSRLGWRWSMRTAGLTTGILGLLSCLMIGRQDVHMDTEDSLPADSPRIPALKLIFGTDLAMILIACIFNGYVRDSIMNWAPKMLVDTQGIDLSGALGVMLIIPMINFLGIQFGKHLYQRQGQHTRRTSGWLLGLCAAFSLVLMLGYQVSPLLCTVLLGLCSAMSYGINPLLTSFLPMDYRRLGRVGMAAGLLDAMIYAGSALSGSFAGMLYDAVGWSAVFASWAVFSVVGVVLFWLAERKKWSV